MATHQYSDKPNPSFHLIFNPIAGPGEPGEKLPDIESGLEELKNVTVHHTQKDVGAHSLAQKALQAGADVLIVAGGDGTVSGVAAALVDTDVPLGIIPTGTANSFAAAVGITGSIANACEIIRTGCGKRVDTARSNGHLMLLATCIGFEANLLTDMNREEKSRLGRLAIVTNGLKQLKNVEQFDTTLEDPEADNPDGRWQEPATAVTIANTATMGMVLAQGPADIQPDDGHLSITVVTPDHRWDALTSAANLFLSGLQQRSVNDETVHSHKASQMTVTTDPPQRVYVDGEPAGETPVTVRCYPRSLTVIVPNTDDN